MRGYVQDGFFSAEHLKMRNPADDVFLSDGTGYMVADGPYKRHLALAHEQMEVRFGNLM